MMLIYWTKRKPKNLVLLDPGRKPTLKQMKEKNKVQFHVLPLQCKAKP